MLLAWSRRGLDRRPAADALEPRVQHRGIGGHERPDRAGHVQKWGDYASFGEPVAPSKFIPMKTPLSPTLLADPAAFENVLTLPAFLEAQLKLGRKVGSIIGPCNHDCLRPTTASPRTFGACT